MTQRWIHKPTGHPYWVYESREPDAELIAERIHPTKRDKIKFRKKEDIHEFESWERDTR